MNQPARAGLIISKSVGGAVKRNRLARKIRHAIFNQYSEIPNGGLLVIRGLNKSADSQCANEISKIISHLVMKANSRVGQK